MKTYKETKFGFEAEGVPPIPKDDTNRHYIKMMSEVDHGKAEIIPYSEPSKSPEQIRDEGLQSIVLDLDGDGVRVIQCRPAKFAQDESNMRNAIEKMERDGTIQMAWFMSDDTVHQVTVADLQAAIASGQDQASVIWDQFFAAILGG